MAGAMVMAAPGRRAPETQPFDAITHYNQASHHERAVTAGAHSARGGRRDDGERPTMRGRFGDYTLDTATRELVRDAGPLHISPKALDLLQMLIEARPRALSKQEILDQVWAGTFISDGTLSVVVSELRGILNDDPREPRFIRTVQRFGYAFCADVELLPEQTEGTATTFRLLWGGREIALAPGRNILGRCREAVAWIDDPSISRRHAVIEIADHAYIQDLESRNGTFVRGHRISDRQRLADGDPISLGRVAMTFRIFRDGGPTASIHSTSL